MFCTADVFFLGCMQGYMGKARHGERGVSYCVCVLGRGRVFDVAGLALCKRPRSVIWFLIRGELL